jgi:hypothetical protein
MASLGDLDRRHLVETLRAPLRAVGRVAVAGRFITGGVDALLIPGPRAGKAAELGVPPPVMAERPVRRR